MKMNARDPLAKVKHLDACLLEDSQYKKTTGLESIELPNEAGRAIALADVCLAVRFLGKTLAAPLMIAPMTGGVERGQMLNERFARVAEQFQIPMGVGSQRLALENPQLCGLFQVRKWAPTTLIFGNLGAANLTPDNAVNNARRAVEMIKADALFIHFNAMQEACQSDGDVDLRQSLKALEQICSALERDKIPVFAREVGFGLSQMAVRRFLDAGVGGLDCAGAGGTSWAKVESLCASDSAHKKMGQVFGEWGIPTAESIQNVRSVSREVPLVACGGIRNGLDVLKALSLGADVAAMARPFLLAALMGESELEAFVEQCLLELKVGLFGMGKTGF